MKLVPLLLGTSLVANATLLAVILHFAPPSRMETPSVSNPISSTQPPSASGDSGAETTAAIADKPSAAKLVSWRSLNDANLADMVARLRAAGFSTVAIRGLVYARLNEQMAEKRKALLKGLEDTPYWKVKRPMFDSKFMMAQREYYQEQTKIMKEVLGRDAMDHNELAEYFRKRQYGDIPAEKEEKLQRVLGDYGDLRNNIYSEANGMIMPEDREKIAYLEKEMRNDMAEILTPAEMENYELRSSSTANQLRSQLTTFQPTEAEFRALFHATRAIEDKYGDSQMGLTPDQRQQRTAALNEQAKLALSPDRYAQFEQATDPANMMLNRVVARYELPETVVPQVATVQKDIQQRVAALRQLSAAEQTVQAQALQQEAVNKLKPLLGDTAYRAYQVYGGQWLDQITRPPSRGPANNPSAAAPKVAPKG